MIGTVLASCYHSLLVTGIDMGTKVTNIMSPNCKRYLQAEIDALQAVVEQQKKAMKAGSDALLAFAKEIALLKAEHEARKELPRSFAVEARTYET